MPTRMEEIAARSAQSLSEYEENKAANDALAASWRDEKDREVVKRAAAVEKAYDHRPGFSIDTTVQPFTPPVVLAPVLMPPTVSEPPVDLVDYSVAPRSMEVNYSTLPAGGVAFGIPPVMGTMMVMLGKRMLVSMAVTALEFAAMEPLQQYGKGLPRARVLWHTGKSAGSYASANHAPAGAYYPSEDMSALDYGKSALHFGSDVSDWVSEQVRSWFGFPNWLD